MGTEHIVTGDHSTDSTICSLSFCVKHPYDGIVFLVVLDAPSPVSRFPDVYFLPANRAQRRQCPCVIHAWDTVVLAHAILT